MERRVLEVGEGSYRYGAAQLAEDFPGGIAPGAAIAVSQYGPGFGWGVEAQASLIV